MGTTEMPTHKEIDKSQGRMQMMNTMQGLDGVNEGDEY